MLSPTPAQLVVRHRTAKPACPKSPHAGLGSPASLVRDGLVTYGPPGLAAFAPDGTVLWTGVASRAFGAHGLVFKLTKTICLPGGAICGEGPGGVLLVRHPPQGDSLIEGFAVYEEGTSRALSFVLGRCLLGSPSRP